MITINGKSNAISTSKIRKITAIKKNCNEKGRREDDFGSNPHSKGEFFSRSENVFFEIIVAIIITSILINKMINAIVNIKKITYTKFN